MLIQQLEKPKTSNSKKKKRSEIFSPQKIRPSEQARTEFSKNEGKQCLLNI